MSVSQSKEVDFEKLKFMRVFTPMHVPKELIEQVRDRCFDVDEWYNYLELTCMRNTPNGPQLNPLSMLYVIADEGNKVIGMLWCIVEPLSKVLIIQTFSMDKKYWYRGKAVTLLANKAKEILKECKLKKIIWMTSYPLHSQRYGFKRSKSVAMEYTEEEDGTVIGKSTGRVRGSDDGQCEAHGECTADESGAERLSEPVSSGSGTGCERSDKPVPATV